MAQPQIFRATNFRTFAVNADLKEINMSDAGGLIGLAAVVLSLGIPMAAMYTYFRVKKLRSDERTAAIARGVAVPFAAEVSPTARSRKNAILLISGAIGYMAACGALQESLTSRTPGLPWRWALSLSRSA